MAICLACSGLAGVVALLGCQQEKAAPHVGELDEFHIQAALRLVDGDDVNASGNARVWLRHFAPDDRQANLALAKALSGATVAGRREILAALSTIAPDCQRAVPYIERALQDEDAVVRCRAIEALFRLKLSKDEAVDLIDKELTKLGPLEPEFDDDGEVRRRADWLVQSAAASVLWRLKRSRRAVYLLSDVAVATGSEPQTILILYRGAPDSVRFLAERLQAERRSERFTALATLAWLGPNAKPAEAAVIAAMSEDHIGIRHIGAEVLGRITSETDGAAATLDRLLADGSPDERFAAAKSLARMQRYRPEVVDLLIEKLKDASPVARRTACYALGQIGSQAEQATPTLAAALSENDESVRKASMTALARIGPSTIPTFIAALGDRNPRRRETALQGLRYVPGDRSAAIPRILELVDDDDRNVAIAAPFVLADLEAVDDALELLIRQIRENKDPGIRQACAWSLHKAMRENDRVISVLVESLNDDDDGLSEFALRALSDLGPRAVAAESAILDICRGKRTVLHASAVTALGSLRSPTTIPPLSEFLSHSESWDVRANAALALGKLGAPARSAINDGLTDDDPGVLTGAVRALYDIDGRPDKAVPPLIDLAQRWHFDPVNGNMYQIMAILALEHIGADARAAVPMLRRMTAVYDLSLSLAATNALWKITGSPDEVLDAYFNLLAVGDDEIRRSVAGGLGAMGPAAQEAESRLVLLLEDDAIGVRLAALSALESLQRGTNDVEAQP